jgi:hypothetical protein
MGELFDELRANDPGQSRGKAADEQRLEVVARPLDKPQKPFEDMAALS